MSHRALNTSALLLLAALSASAAQATGTNERHERSSVLGAKVGLAQAIQAAESTAKGKAVSAGLEYADDKAFYEVTVVAGDERQTVMLDPATGKVTGSERSTRARKHDDAVVAGALARAVTSAETAAKAGKALEAEYVDRDEVTRIRVEVAQTQDAVQIIDVDASTGRVIPPRADVKRAGDRDRDHEGAREERHEGAKRR